MTQLPAEPYDTLLLVSFGGPERMADVLPFLRHVTHGRDVPPERLAAVAAQYEAVGGVSPLNAANRRLLAAIQAKVSDLGLAVAWGNRHAEPFLADTLTALATAGSRRVLAFVTSAYSSYSGCRQYREELAAALGVVRAAGLQPPTVDRLRQYFDHPGFVEPFVDSTLAALAGLPSGSSQVRLLFATHSLPVAAAAVCGPAGGAYVAQHQAVAALVARRVNAETGMDYGWELVFQSRSGPPRVPWLEPDVNDRIDALAQTGTDAVVVVPIGFVSDHMEVVWDLDTVAAQRCRAAGMAFARASTPGTDARFAGMVRELVLERTAGGARRALSPGGPAPDRCPASCCPNPAGRLPAVGEAGPATLSG
ncbi:MAG: ferrochelatase [Actinomycetota bacterium]|nr:MAG: ferrochelatase [Actinomycetota bacterium]